MKLVDRIKYNPLHYMSLGSKELFHSNVWAWLIESYDLRFAKCFFVDIDINAIKSVGREEGNRDLTIWTKDNKAFVIENKFKSMPTIEQLLKYEQSFKKDVFQKGLLTGIFNPNFDFKKYKLNWSFLSYQDIAKKILEVLNTIDNKNTYEYQTTKKYVEYLQDLSDIIPNFLNTSKNTLIYDSMEGFQEMENLRLGDLCKKINMNNFRDYLDINDCKIRYEKDGIKWVDNIDFTRKSALISCRLMIETNREETIEIGVQIQGSQYRKYFTKCSPDIKKSNIEEQEKMFNYLKSVNWFSDIKEDKTLFEHKTSLEKDYNKFIKDQSYSMIYQYWNIEDYSFMYLKDNLIHDLDLSLKIINELKNKNHN